MLWDDKSKNSIETHLVYREYYDNLTNKKCTLSSVSNDRLLEALLKMQAHRHCVERLFQEVKYTVDMDQYQCRPLNERYCYILLVMLAVLDGAKNSLWGSIKYTFLHRSNRCAIALE
jgi:hypothetical protein